MHCRQCGTTDESQFASDRSRHDGFSRLCRECDRERRTARRNTHRNRLTGWLYALIGRGCQRCSEQHPVALDILVSGRTYAISYLEAGKNPTTQHGCRILCANCQRKLKIGIFVLSDVPILATTNMEINMAGMTLAEVLKKKFRDKFGKPLEVGAHADKNPLEARVGGIITIDTNSEKDLFYTVKEIAHAVEDVGGKLFPFTDYVLVATPGGDDDRADENGKVRRILRVIPVEERDKYLQFNCVLLSLFYECDYNQAQTDNLFVPDYNVQPNTVYPVLQDPAGEFNDFDTGDKYIRRFRGFAGWEKPHVVNYTILRDVDGNGRVDEDEVVDGREIQFWDYEGADNSKTFVYVEQDVDGYFRLYRGSQVIQESIVRL